MMIRTALWGDETPCHEHGASSEQQDAPAMPSDLFLSQGEQQNAPVWTRGCVAANPDPYRPGRSLRNFVTATIMDAATAAAGTTGRSCMHRTLLCASRCCVCCGAGANRCSCNAPPMLHSCFSQEPQDFPVMLLDAISAAVRATWRFSRS